MDLILILFVIQLTYSLGAELECKGPHEQLWKNTWVCPLQCNNLHFMRCLSIIEGKPSCQCKDGTVWDLKKRKCVYLTECSEYNRAQPIDCNAENEVFAESVSACPATCAHPGGPLCAALIHKPSCVCAKGTVRDTVNNRCVKVEECPEKETTPIPYEIEEQLKCNGTNEEYKEWVSPCQEQCLAGTTPAPIELDKCMTLEHKPSCVCTNGTIRDTIFKRCVPRDQCPPIPFETNEQLECNGENEIFAEVVSACPPTCAHPVGPLCAALIHKPSCVCNKGWVRDTVSNKCVKVEECLKKETPAIPYETNQQLVCNGLNEQYSEWVSACPDECPKIGIQPPTDTPVLYKCMAIIHKPTCICINGTIRDTIQNKCVTRDQCTPIAFVTKQQLQCNGQNEVFAEVVSACPPTCAHPVGPLCNAIIKKPSCVCAEGTVRETASNRCVKREDCFIEEELFIS